MAKQSINLGVAPNGAGGDDRRAAWLKAINNFDELYAFLGGDALTEALPIAKGGTGGKTQAAARTGLGLKTAAIADAVGDVAQGALMQYVSNSTGEYWRFASGLVISSQTVSVGALSWSAGTGLRYLNVTAGLPVTFVAAPRVFVQINDNDISARSAWVTAAIPTASTCSNWFAANAGTTGAGAFSFNILAVGRWK